MADFSIPALRIAGISKSFHAGKNQKKALSDVSFSIEQGDFFGLLGPNGAGKSTLIGVLAKTEPPTAEMYLFLVLTFAGTGSNSRWRSALFLKKLLLILS